MKNLTKYSLFEGVNWEPIEIWLKHIFGEENMKRAICQWMFMNQDTKDNKIYYYYKNGITRKYLVLDDEGLPYMTADNGDMIRISFVDSFKKGYQDIEKMFGVESEPWFTQYGCDYIQKRNDALKQAGYKPITINDIEKDIGKLDFNK